MASEEHVPPPRGWKIMWVVRWLLVVGMLAAAVFAIGWRHGWFDHVSHGAKAVTYYCPMHPGQTSDHPGDCPICGMSMVPKPESNEAPPPQPVGKPAAGILVQRIEEIPCRAEETDGRDGRAERLQVFRQESLPQILAEREQEHRDGDRDNVPLEAERLCHRRSAGHHD